VSDTRPRFQFYGRRKGHALRRHHLLLIETLLPKLRVDLKNPLPEFPLLPCREAWEKVPGRADEGSPSPQVPTSVVSAASSQEPLSGLRPPSPIRSANGRRQNTDYETWLEIGFGGGEHLAHQASLHGNIHFIGAEFFVNGVAKLLALIEEKQLANVRIYDGDARNLLEVLPDASLTRVYLLYPDPWPKARHKKRRFVSPENLSHIHRLLKSGGFFIFASDIPDYISWTQELMAERGGFELCEHEINRPPEGWVGTRYEAKAKAEGRTPAYLRYRRL
jgi:tRNA (guanine-N7-)-methyltransferase